MKRALIKNSFINLGLLCLLSCAFVNAQESFSEMQKREEKANAEFEGKFMKDLILAWGNPDQIITMENNGLRVKKGDEPPVIGLVYKDRKLVAYFTKSAKLQSIIFDHIFWKDFVKRE